MKKPSEIEPKSSQTRVEANEQQEEREPIPTIKAEKIRFKNADKIYE